MTEFLYLFRLTPQALQTEASPEELQARVSQWSAWFERLATAGHILSPGHRVMPSGAIVRDREGATAPVPSSDGTDVVSGYTVICARDLLHAQELTRDCPIFEQGGVVEVRPVRQS